MEFVYIAMSLGTVRRIWEAVSSDAAPFWLAVCQVIFYAMMPVFDSLIYGMTKGLQPVYQCMIMSITKLHQCCDTAVRKHDLKLVQSICCGKGDE